MNYDTEAYEAAINAHWIKLDKAQTNEELQDVLNTWPEQGDYIIDEKEEKEETDEV